MAEKQTLQNLLLSLKGVGPDDKLDVYFQPPDNLSMNYPCIRYELSSAEVKHANNMPYAREKEYILTVIDRNPNSKIPDKLGTLPKCRFSRFYTAAGLNHFVFYLYF